MIILHYSDKRDDRLLDLYAKCDVVVTTGDLDLFDFQGLRDGTLTKPAFGVYGNHDSGHYLNDLGIINLHQQIYDFAGYRWGGFQGCLRYKQADAPMFDEAEAEHWAATFPPVDILLLHAGPLQMLDDPIDSVHIGSSAVRQYVLKTKPKYVFCGHQYSDDAMEYDGIKLYRTYGARLIGVNTI